MWTKIWPPAIWIPTLRVRRAQTWERLQRKEMSETFRHLMWRVIPVNLPILGPAMLCRNIKKDPMNVRLNKVLDVVKLNIALECSKNRKYIFTGSMRRFYVSLPESTKMHCLIGIVDWRYPRVLITKSFTIPLFERLLISCETWKTESAGCPPIVPETPQPFKTSVFISGLFTEKTPPGKQPLWNTDNDNHKIHSQSLLSNQNITR